MGQGIGFKDDDGSYGFKLTDDGKVVLGNTTDDVIQVTGTLSILGQVSSSVEVSASAFYSDAIHTDDDSIYVDIIRRKSDSSTSTKIRLQDEVVKIHAGNVNDEVLKVESDTVTLNGDLVLNQYIKHNGDNDTLINFTDNRIVLKAGNLALVTAEKNSSAPHEVTINDGSNNVDFVVKGNGSNQGNPGMKFDASTNKLGINGIGTPAHELDVDGTIQSSALICNGSTILGNTSGDILQVTGTMSLSGTLYAGTESPEQYHQITGRLLVDAAGTNNSEFIIDGPNPNFIILNRNGSQTGKLATDGSRFTTYGGSNMLSQAYTDGSVGKIDFCSSNTQVTSGTKHKVNITASTDAFRIDTDSGTNIFRVSGDTAYATEITASGNISGSAFYGDGTNLTNGGQLISQTIIDGSSTTFSCETASSTYKQINDDTTAAKVASITFTVPDSRKVLVTMTVAARDFDGSSQLFRVRITDSNSESTEGSWGSAWNDEQISGHYATDFFNHTFQWYFDGTVSPHSWSVGDSKTMYFQLKVDGTDETVSLKAGNNYAPLVISATTVPTGVSFVDMDS